MIQYNTLGTCEEQSRKRLRQWVSHGARLKWSLWTDLVGGREWRPHASRGAKSKKKKKKRQKIYLFEKTQNKIKKIYQLSDLSFKNKDNFLVNI